MMFFCVQVYTSIYLKTSVKLAPGIVDQLSIYTTLALFPLTIFAGFLSDVIGRKPVIVFGLAIGAIFILPTFYLLQLLGAQYLSDPNNNYSLFLISLLLIFLSLALALVVGPQTAILAELFPAKTRNSAATFPHNLAAGWIGGLLPLIITWLNEQLQSDILGLLYPTTFLAMGAIIGAIFLPETKKCNLSD